MSVRLIRAGGFFVFLTPVVAFVGGAWLSDAALSGVGPGMTAEQAVDAVGSTAQSGGLLLGLVVNALIILILWSTKALFNAAEYRGGDIPIFLLIAGIIIGFVLSYFGGPTPGDLADVNRLIAVGLAAIVGLFNFVVMAVCIGWLSLACLGYGRVVGSGLWKAIGVLYLIVCACFVMVFASLLFVALNVDAATPASSFVGLAGLVGIVLLGGFLVIVVGWICHGVGLLTGAGRLARGGAVGR